MEGQEALTPTGTPAWCICYIIPEFRSLRARIRPVFQLPARPRIDQISGHSHPNPEQQSRIARLDAGMAAACRWRLKDRRARMNLIIVIIVGGVLGWLASLIMRTDAQQGIIMNIVVGIVGALIGGWLLGPLLGGGSITSGGFLLPKPLVFPLRAGILFPGIHLIPPGNLPQPNRQPHLKSRPAPPGRPFY